MNRLLICIILLATVFPLTGQTVLAEKLYRWVESDGSITFSPTPPPAGTDYKAVNAAHNNAAKEDLPELDQKPSILATSEHGLEPELKINANEMLAQPMQAQERQKLSYAPEISSKNNLNGNSALSITAAELETNKPTLIQTDTVAASKKRRQCQDLNKRVLSLERRMRSPLKPVEMDNTVVAMARYQRSYDRHCVD